MWQKLFTHLYKSGKKVLCRMPFLPQPFPFIQAWDWHQETQKCVSDVWMELPGKRKRGRPKRRFLDVIKEDMEEVGAKEMDIEDRKMWRMMIRCGHP